VPVPDFEDLVRSILRLDGVCAVGLFDWEGESIVSLGWHDEEQFKLVGAYQGILLNAVKRFSECPAATVVNVLGKRSILTHQLKDGYFICVIFAEVQYASLDFKLKSIYPLIENEL